MEINAFVLSAFGRARAHIFSTPFNWDAYLHFTMNHFQPIQCDLGAYKGIYCFIMKSCTLFPKKNL